MPKSPEQMGDAWKWAEFADSSNNVMKLNKMIGNSYAFELKDEPGKGYVTTYKEGKDEIWPGSINSWFGPNERFSSAEQALDYYSEVEELEAKGIEDDPITKDDGPDSGFKKWMEDWDKKHQK